MKEEALQIIEEKKELFIQLSDDIWDHPETSFQEEYAAKRICEILEEEGFQVTKGLAGIPTAFRGVYGEGRPVIGILGEYDALFDMSQKSGNFQEEPLEKGQPGHGCGHNLLGTGALAGAVAAREYLRRTGRQGTVVYFGCPGEEGGSGKTFMVRDGVFKDVDCVFTWHPETLNIVPPFATLANCQIIYHFKGISAHASSSPHLGRSALDALELLNIGVQFLREHVKQDVRIHYAITNAGGKSPNVVPAEAEVLYLIRTARSADLPEIYGRVNDIAKGAALMTGTEVEWKMVKACSDILPNVTLSRVMQQNMESIGIPSYTREELEYEKCIDDTVVNRKMLLEEAAAVAGKKGQELAAFAKGKAFYDFLIPFMPLDHCLNSSTDVGDVSYVCPTAQVATATISAHTPVHSWQEVSQGKSSVAHKGMLFAGKIIGASVIDVIDNPELVERARQEWKEKIGDIPYVSPIPPEVKPCVDGIGE